MASGFINFKALWVLGCNSLSNQDSIVFVTVTIDGDLVWTSGLQRTDSASHWVVNARIPVHAWSVIEIGIHSTTDTHPEVPFVTATIRARDLAKDAAQTATCSLIHSDGNQDGYVALKMSEIYLPDATSPVRSKLSLGSNVHSLIGVSDAAASPTRA